jgi:medium-chain acyl-[acyl-carrier-protein] hydrolase
MPFESRAGKWLLVPERNDEARFRLVLFPYAGGGASAYYPWIRAFGDLVELVIVQLPGRETRVAEPLLTDANEMAQAIASAISVLQDKPYAFFGHSFGSLLAYETCLALRAANRPMPFGLVVSGRSAPSQPAQRPPVAELPREQFFEHLLSLGGIPRELFDVPELIDFVEPILRADLRAHENYIWSAAPRLSIPMLALGGDEDDAFPPEDIEAWRAMTNASFKMRILHGNHFFLNSDRRTVFKEISVFLDAFGPASTAAQSAIFAETREHG